MSRAWFSHESILLHKFGRDRSDTSIAVIDLAPHKVIRVGADFAKIRADGDVCSASFAESLNCHFTKFFLSKARLASQNLIRTDSLVISKVWR